MSSESPSSVHIDIEPGYESFVPDLFRQQPVEYFEALGVNIRPEHSGMPGERIDSSAVKELPVWTNADGKELRVVGKRVDMKSECIASSGNPYYECEIIKIVNSVDLPAPKLVAKAEQGGVHLFIMEKIDGTNWYDKTNLALKEKGFTDEEILALYHQAEEILEAMKNECDQAGVIREWKLSDAIFDIDFDQKKVRGMVPTDWTCTKIDQVKLEAYRKGKG